MIYLKSKRLPVLVLSILLFLPVLCTKKKAIFEKEKKTGGIDLIHIPAGTFLMGSARGNGADDEYPQHKVRVNSFWIGKFEITQKQYSELMYNNPARGHGISPKHPVYYVTWEKATAYCKQFSEKYKVEARLPTEAEWEYACRANTEKDYYWGVVIDSKYTWYKNNSNGTTHRTGSREPNKWGLYDMSGNVWEWCQDYYGWQYYRESETENPKGPEHGKLRVLRGGSWYDTAKQVRSATRFGYYPTYKFNLSGFRIVVEEE